MGRGNATTPWSPFLSVPGKRPSLGKRGLLPRRGFLQPPALPPAGLPREAPEAAAGGCPSYPRVPGLADQGRRDSRPSSQFLPASGGLRGGQAEGGGREASLTRCPEWAGRCLAACLGRVRPPGRGRERYKNKPSSRNLEAGLLDALIKTSSRGSGSFANTTSQARKKAEEPFVSPPPPRKSRALPAATLPASLAALSR